MEELLQAFFGIIFAVSIVVSLLWLVTLPRRRRMQKAWREAVESLHVSRNLWQEHEAVSCQIEYLTGIWLNCRLVIYWTGEPSLRELVLFDRQTSLSDLGTHIVRRCKNRIWESISNEDHDPPQEETRDLIRLRSAVGRELTLECEAVLRDGGIQNPPRLLIVLSSPKWSIMDHNTCRTEIMSVLDLSAVTQQHDDPAELDAVAVSLLAHEPPTSFGRNTQQGIPFVDLNELSSSAENGKKKPAR